MPRVFISDKLEAGGLNLLKQAGLEVDNRPGLSGAALQEALQAADGVVVRSGTRITAELLQNPGKLRAIVRAGVGVDNIDVAAAPDPYPSVRAPAEHVASPAATAPVQQQQQSQVTHVAAATTAPHRARVVPAKRSTPRKTALPKHKAAPVRTPDHPAPRLVALGRTVLEPPHRTSRTLAVALGLLVLLSASLVAGAARELAR